MPKIIYDPSTDTIINLDGAELYDIPSEIKTLEDTEYYILAAKPELSFANAVILEKPASIASLNQEDGTAPSMDWDSKPHDNLWITIHGLSVKIKHDDEGIVVDIFDDLDADSISSTFAQWPGDHTETG